MTDYRGITSANAIQQFIHCHLCLRELPLGESPQSYRQLDVGFTLVGLQVWCVRHEVNVIHIDFEGAKHPANLMRRA